MYFRIKFVLAITLLNIVLGTCMAQTDNRQVDSILITMTTPYDAGVKWNCSCVIHDNLVSVSIKESCRSIEIPEKKIVMPAKVIHRFFELSDEQNVFCEDYKPLHLVLSSLAFEILEQKEAIMGKNLEEIEPDTVWSVSIFKKGKPIDFFSIGNFSRSDDSYQLTRLSHIIERFVFVGRFSTVRHETGICSDNETDRNQ